MLLSHSSHYEDMYLGIKTAPFSQDVHEFVTHAIVVVVKSCGLTLTCVRVKITRRAECEADSGAFGEIKRAWWNW